MGNKNQPPKPPEQSASDKMFDTLFEFKHMSKQFSKEAVKAARQEEALYLKVKDCIEKNMMENAKVFAADAIRKKNEVKRYQVLSSKIDAVYSRMQNAYQTQKLTENMSELTQKMMTATNNMDLVQINETMGNFEKLFDNLDVNSQMMNEAFDNVNAGVTNEKEVNNLIGQVAEKFGLEVKDEFETISPNKNKVEEGATKNKVANPNLKI